jgi:hypothetical protein
MDETYAERIRSALTPKRRELFDGMLASGWAEVEGRSILIIRWDSPDLEFPQYMRDWPSGAYKYFPETYRRHVFLSMVTTIHAPMVRLCHAPWAGAHDQDVTLRRALEVLKDPAGALG